MIRKRSTSNTPEQQETAETQVLFFFVSCFLLVKGIGDKQIDKKNAPVQSKVFRALICFTLHVDAAERHLD